MHLLDLPRWAALKASGPQVLPIQSAGPLHRALLGAVEEAGSSQSGSYENAMAYTTVFRNLLLRELRPSRSGDGGRMRLRLSGLWSEVNRSLDENWTVKRLASRVKLSESALYQQVAACHGLSPGQMVTWLRMERAKDLLRHSDQTLQEIAEAVGYQTAYSLSDAFRRHTGQRPGQFRRGGER